MVCLAQSELRRRGRERCVGCGGAGPWLLWHHQSYYWHAGSDATANFDTWRRIVSGSAALRRALTMISLHTHLLLNLSCCTTSTRKQWWAIYR